jgi:uncharacterized Zn-finger protein
MNVSSSEDASLAGEDSGESFNFKCKYCHRNLSSRQNLREHIYIHTGEKPYVCTEIGCGQSFRQGSLLSIHKKIHSEISKGLKEEKKRERRCQYPKLTTLISATRHKMDVEMNDEERFEWVSKIGNETFGFVGTYLNRVKY